MDMKKYLIDTFSYNDSTNKTLLSKIELLKDKRECIKLFSHLINCQIKWLARIKQQPGYVQLDWWEPVYKLDELEQEWTKSLTPWLNYIDANTEDGLSTEVEFIGFDNSLWAATPLDIALQLNYHSIHHRAQMQTIIRSQGIEPDFVDYIGTKYRKLG